MTFYAPKYMTFKEKSLHVMDNTHAFDGHTLAPIDKDDLKTFWRKPNTTENMYVHINKLNEYYGMKFKTLNEAYKQFESDIEKLKRRNHDLNLYKAGGSLTKCAMQFFLRQMKKQNIKEEKTGTHEVSFIERGKYSAVQFADEYEGKAYKFDVISHYPSVMMDSNNSFPVKQGTLMTITTLDDLPEDFYGLLECVIDDTSTHFMRSNNKHVHTHIDIKQAQKKGLMVKIVQKPDNCLYYPPDTLRSGSDLFKTYVERVFYLKNCKDEPLSKIILNCLWGYFCRYNISKKVVNPDEEFQVPEGCTLNTMNELKDGSYFVDYYKTQQPFLTDYARISPFVMAYGRQKVFDIMEPVEKYVVRCHTDGFMCRKDVRKKLKKVIGEKVGDLRYEGKSKHIKINHVNDIDGMNSFSI